MAVLVPVVHKSLLLLTSLLTCCSKGPQADLQYIKEARSAAAEWALVNEQSSKGTVTATYVRSMHQWLRQELTSSQSAISAQDSSYGDEIRTLLAQPDDAAPEELRSHADVLKNIEDGIEST